MKKQVKKILLIVLMMCLGISVFSEEMPKPVKSVEGDSEEVITTVGHMRKALWYYDFATETWLRLQESEKTIEELIEDSMKAESTIDELIYKVADVTVSYNNVKVALITVSSVFAAAIIGVIVYAIAN